ncbi:MAG: hypothetical protein U0800_12695 [Isosphaeraceae bacterium]
MARPPKKHYATLNRSGTEAEITIYTPDGRAMFYVGIWDTRQVEDPANDNPDQVKADAELIVDALNTHLKAARWFRALNAAEVFLRMIVLAGGASPGMRKMHRRLLNAI